jgi:SAM-dependent methyltransferase
MTIRQRIEVAKLRIRRKLAGELKPGSAEYFEHNRQELAEFRDAFNEFGVERVPRVWDEIQDRGHRLIESETGASPHDHVLNRLQAGMKLLSLGSGGGGVERHYAWQRPEATVVGLDLNPEVVAAANASAYPNLRFEVADLNTVELPRAAYDIVFAHASLHHLLALEHVMEQVSRTLRPKGWLVVHDVIPPSGFLMRPDTRRAVHDIFRVLPARFRVNHAAYPQPAVDREIWEVDTRIHGMECIRSGEVVGQLDRHFRREVFYPYLTIARRFLDPMYGPNYDLAAPLDRATADWIWEMDLHYLRSGQLQGESLFAIYRPV